MANYQSVLIIDDDPTQTVVLRAYFQQLGVSLIETSNDARKLFTDGLVELPAFDLIVTDLQMPGMDGFELLRHLKESGFQGKLAIISGVARNMLEHATRLAGMHGLSVIGRIAKPLKKAALDDIFLHSAETAASYPGTSSFKISAEEFKRIMEAGEIRPYYQPQVDIMSGKVVGAETLARWVKPDGQIMPPTAFLPVAEENGLMGQLTLSLYKQVLADMQTFLKVDPTLGFAVNLSPDLVPDISLPDTLLRLLTEAGVPPSSLHFEITENSILDLDTTTLEVVSRLRINGHEVSIDDFGTGSSNIQTLRDFPFTELKIDRAFIHEAHSNEFSAQTVSAAAALARQLNMKTVAEGVEDIADWNFAREVGVDRVQGYFVSKALNPLGFLNFLNKNANGIDPVAIANAA